MIKTALIVDNSKSVLKMLSGVLKEQQYDVRVAENGIIALDILKTFQPQVIFLDMIMPNISGDELCRIIRSDPKHQSAYIIILSAIAAEEEIDFVGFGADACIAKGPAPELTKNIKTVLYHAENKDMLQLTGRVLGAETVYQREITRELLATKKHFEATLENMADGFVELNPQGSIIYINTNAATIFRKKRQELLSKPFLALFATQQQDIIQDCLEALGKGTLHIGEDFPILIDDGFYTLTLVHCSHDNESSVLVLLHDITKRKKAENELKMHLMRLEELVNDKTVEYEEANERLKTEIQTRKKIQARLEMTLKEWRKTFDTITDFVSLHDNQMRIIRANKALAAFFEKQPAELIGKKCHEIIHSCETPWPSCPHVESMKSGKTVTEIVEDPHLKKTLLVTCSPYFNDEGKVVGSVHVARDITNEKKIEKEKERLITELRDALAKVKLLSGFIPICAACKKIRDDSGFWQQIELYIREHSEAEFSHSICPDCAKELYPEEYESLYGNKDESKD